MRMEAWLAAEVEASPVDRFIALLAAFTYTVVAPCALFFYGTGLAPAAFWALRLMAAVCLLLKGAELYLKRLGQNSAACRMGRYARIAWRLVDRFLVLAVVGSSLGFIAYFLSHTYELIIPLVLLLIVQLALRLSELWCTRIDAHKLARLSLEWRVQVHHGTQIVVAVIAMFVFLSAFIVCMLAGIVPAEIRLVIYLLGFPYYGLLRLTGSRKRQIPWRAEQARLLAAVLILVFPLWARTVMILRSKAADRLMGKYGRKFFV